MVFRTISPLKRGSAIRSAAIAKAIGLVSNSISSARENPNSNRKNANSKNSLNTEKRGAKVAISSAFKVKRRADRPVIAEV